MIAAACTCGAARAVVAYADALLREVDEGLEENRLWLEPRAIFISLTAAAIAASSEALAWVFVEAERDPNQLMGEDVTIVTQLKGTPIDLVVLRCWRAWCHWTVALQTARDLADDNFVIPEDLAHELLESQPGVWFPHAYPCNELNARGGAA